MNFRVNGTEMFRNNPDGAESILQIRSANLSDDDRLVRFLTHRPGSSRLTRKIPVRTKVQTKKTCVLRRARYYLGEHEKQTDEVKRLPMNKNVGGQITQRLQELVAGDQRAVNELFELLYPELLDMAQLAMRNERRDHTLQPTALVHEAVGRLLRGKGVDGLENSTALFALASMTMRSVLVDHARKRNAGKRPCGRGRNRMTLDDVIVGFEKKENVDLIALDEALQELNAQSTRQHEVVNLHFFGGMSFPVIAKHLNVSLSTVEKDWRFARTWLLRRFGGDSDAQSLVSD